MYRNAGNLPDDYEHSGFVHWDNWGIIADGVGSGGDQIHFADMNSDGQADYVWISAEGKAAVWWNNGFDPSRVDHKINRGSLEWEVSIFDHWQLTETMSNSQT